MSITPEPSDHLRVVAVIQARMGSTRLPGKVLKPIAGKPLLWHIVHRLKRSQFIEKIAIATSTNPRDDAIVEFGRENGVAVMRGPEDDVLARFARAAELLDADIIVRVSADAPFVDAGFIDHLVAALIEQNGDYVLLEEGAVTGHEGVDPFSRRALDKLMMDASDDPVAREHVTGYFKLHPDFVRIARAPAYPALARGRTADGRHARRSRFRRSVARTHGGESRRSLAGRSSAPARTRTLVARKERACAQKPIQASGGLALIRCDGGGRFGYGHVKRMVALARALRDREGMGAIFAVNGSEDALVPIPRAGFEASFGYDLSRRWAADRHARARYADCDLREGLDARRSRTRTRSALSAVIDDGSARGSLPTSPIIHRCRKPKSSTGPDRTASRRSAGNGRCWACTPRHTVAQSVPASHTSRRHGRKRSAGTHDPMPRVRLRNSIPTFVRASSSARAWAIARGGARHRRARRAISKRLKARTISRRSMRPAMWRSPRSASRPTSSPPTACPRFIYA